MSPSLFVPHEVTNIIIYTFSIYENEIYVLACYKWIYFISTSKLRQASLAEIGVARGIDLNRFTGWSGFRAQSWDVALVANWSDADTSRPVALTCVNHSCFRVVSKSVLSVIFFCSSCSKLPLLLILSRLWDYGFNLTVADPLVENSKQILIIIEIKIYFNYNRKILKNLK